MKVYVDMSEDGSIVLREIDVTVPGRIFADLGLFDEARPGFDWREDSYKASGIVHIALVTNGWVLDSEVPDLALAVARVCEPGPGYEETLTIEVSRDPAWDSPEPDPVSSDSAILDEDQWATLEQVERRFYNSPGMLAFSDVRERSDSHVLALLWEEARAGLEMSETGWDARTKAAQDRSIATRVVQAWGVAIWGADWLLRY